MTLPLFYGRQVYDEITASGIFTFNDKGQVINFEAERYAEFNGEISLETWSIPV